MTAHPLPPLHTFRHLFHYNPLSGEITYTQQRGARAAGSVAGARFNNRPCIFIAGRYHRAAAVAWALWHGVDPSPEHVNPLDGDPWNLRMDNLELSPTPLRLSNAATGRRAKRPGWVRADIRLQRRSGLWRAWYSSPSGRQRLGDFVTRHEAMAARRAAHAAALCAQGEGRQGGGE